MVHLKTIRHLLFFATVILCSCSQEEALLVSDNQIETPKDAVGVTFRLQSNQTSTMTRGVEDSYVHVQGSADEYKVNVARVYLFDAPTKLFAKSFLLTNLKQQGSDADGNVIYESESVMVPQGTYDIFVVANTTRLINQENENDFLADIDNISYAKGQIDDISAGIVMTNRATANLSTSIVNNEENPENVVKIELERVLARIDVAVGSDAFALTTKGGAQYATIKLDGFYVVNYPTYYYSYRHTAVLTTLTEPEWSLSSNFGNVSEVNGYVIDPYFFKKKIDASKFTNADKYYVNFFGDVSNPNAIEWKTFNPAATTPVYKTTYCLENCMLAPAQKNGYSTGVIFRAKVEPYNNVYRLSNSGSLELVTDKKQYPEVLYYFDYKFFASPEALSKYINDLSSVPSDQLSLEARKFEKTDDGYRCYYNYWIRHLDNNKPTVMGVMEFAIVRNNLYRILVANVSDIGTPDTGKIPVDPDTPDEGEAYLKVVINVKPWIVRDQTEVVL